MARSDIVPLAFTCYTFRENNYSDNTFLLDSGILTSAERIFFKRISADMGDVEASLALNELSKYLCRYYGKKVIILLDEYDTPMQEAYLHGYWEELVEFTRGIFNAAFKTNDCFGFTQQEVSDALNEYGLLEKEKDVRDWYDGFTFGSRTDIYNPWSIINYLGERKFSAYWVNTSSDSLAGKLIREGTTEIKMAMEELLRGKKVLIG